MENVLPSVRKNLALKAAIPVALGVAAVGYLFISAYCGTFNPMQWRAKAKTTPPTPTTGG